MTTQNTPMAVLAAHLDEDEEMARAAADEAGEAEWSTGGHFSNAVLTEQAGTAVAVGPWADGFLADDLRDHIARHDPARALRMVEAVRKLLDAHVGYYGDGDDENLPIPTISILARIWDDSEASPRVVGAVTR
ncbi:hypothetical protein GCM10022252_76440 [Streptosporangium oxazolinicum]|uniref:Uncharacterized protein n=1 Tax=Streptosporangium oxazolinicum TaxID=909287 RepID=A0ABP8BL70_9ACTN